MKESIKRWLPDSAMNVDPDPDRARVARDMLESYLHEQSAPGGHRVFLLAPQVAPADTARGRAILEADPALHVAIIRVALEFSMQRLVRFSPHARYSNERSFAELLDPVWSISGLTSQLQRRRQPYSERDVHWILHCLVRSGVTWYLLQVANFSIRSLLRGLVRATEGQELPPETRTLLEQLRHNLADAAEVADGRSTLALIDTWLGNVKPSDSPIDPSDDWGYHAADALAAMSCDERQRWLGILRAVTSSSGSKPSRKWLKQVREHIVDHGEGEFIVGAIDWLRLLSKPSRIELYRRPDGDMYPTAFVADANADLLKGLIWACSIFDDERLVRAVGDAGLACFKKIPNIGSRSTRAGNACIWTLGAISGLGGVTELQRLIQKVTLPSARKQIDRALEAAALRNGLTRADLEDLSVPEFGLRDGVIRHDFSPFTAVTAIDRFDGATLQWERPDGRLQTTVPAEVKRGFPKELTEVQKALKDLRAALAAQKARIEQLLLAERSWPMARWRARYHDHPLLAHLTRSLIWTFEREGHLDQGIWLDDGFVSHNDQRLDGMDDDTIVRLWHPIEADAETVLAWRRWLERHEVMQPFKQAHREVYILTDAERETRTYSNRFATHILRQHQLAALCQQRGWKYRLQGIWDGGNVPQIDLPGWNLRAEFWVDPGDITTNGTSGHGVCLYVATDQVCFSGSDGWQPLPLEEIPPLVFSEVMRDVDLFVGVSSVGVDPNWLDGSEDGRQPDWNRYWWDFAFGELSATAATRHDVLTSLVPSLRIADRCRLDDRYLIVRGDLREYRIHLGSGNVLMEPNDQYLCIVPGGGLPSRSNDQLFLPFDGDATLSIILSKAFLLAADQSITDPTILQQINTIVQ